MDIQHEFNSFIQNNSLEVVEKDDWIVVSNLWQDKTFHLSFPKDYDFRLFESLKLPQKLYAIQTSNRLEFIFQPLKSDFYCIDRSFSFIYNGKEYKTYFSAPSELFKAIAEAFVATEAEVDEKTTYRNIKPFYEFYKKDTLPESIKQSYNDLIPINFFLEGDLDSLDDRSIEKLLNHLNFYMSYFDRNSPWILIEDSKPTEDDFKIPCLSHLKPFPKSINSTNIDGDLLELLHTARKAPTTRLKYLYYFQVLEYASYYFIEDSFRNKINNILKSPDLLVETNKYSHILINEFQNKYYKDNSDSLRLYNVILKHCEYKRIKNEIFENKEYFLKDVEFDGGLKLKRLFKNEGSIESPQPEIMQTIKSNLEKIRNVLVHIRESHENLVILPTARNERLIKPYLYLLRRMAEEVAIRYEYL